MEETATDPSVNPCSPLVYYRNARCSVLRGHDDAFQPNPSPSWKHQVGACVLHRDHVLTGDHVHGDECTAYKAIGVVPRTAILVN